jgi:hypothetical protein
MIQFCKLFCIFASYDINESTPVAFAAVRDFIKKHPKAFDEVRFVLFSDEDLPVLCSLRRNRMLFLRLFKSKDFS